MRLICNRFLYHPFGIFSRWLRNDNSQLMVSITHAFGDSESGWYPLTPFGEYTMKRYQSPTKGLVWQILDVPGHEYILLHTGNWNEDSKGCECVGESVTIGEDPYTLMPEEMVTNSRHTLKLLMEETAEVDEIELTVNA